jgi:hypothetical protein
MALALDLMMDSHQVEGQRRRTFERSMRLLRLKTPDGPQQHGRAERRQGPNVEGQLSGASTNSHSRTRTGPSRATARTRYGAACASRLVQVDTAIEDPALDLDSAVGTQ